MGLRTSIIVFTTSFLLGILFTHWIADSLTLWKSPITNNHLWIAASYYSLLARTPTYFGYALAGVVSLGAVALLWSFNDRAAGNIMFDGGSIFLYGSAVATYIYSVLPDFIPTFSNIPDHAPQVFPTWLQSQILNLASVNLVCSIALTGVLGLQAARWWAESDSDSDDDEPVVSESS